jgi:hypothetical protein
MIRYLTLEEVLELHRLVMDRFGGLGGVRDLAEPVDDPACPCSSSEAHDSIPT